MIAPGLRLHVFRLEPHPALLVAVGSSVCGAAAILSVASMAKEREPHAGVAIALITLAGTVALLLYPSVYRRLHPDAGRTRLRHGGESEIVRKRFFELDETEQKVIYAFISAL